MSRVRIHNYFVSLDGFAAGTVVTAEKPIGDATALFSGFDGRFIHGVGDVDAPITVDRALTTLWGQNIGVEIMGARELAPGSDVRIGGGPSVVRQFIEADLVDFLHVVTVPVTIGEGQRAYPDGLDLTERFDGEFLSTPTGRTHQMWNRRT